MKAPRFEIEKDKAGQFFGRYIGGNGELVMFGQGCHNRADVIDTIENMKREAPDAPIIDLTKEDGNDH